MYLGPSVRKLIGYGRVVLNRGTERERENNKWEHGNVVSLAARTNGNMGTSSLSLLVRWPGPARRSSWLWRMPCRATGYGHGHPQAPTLITITKRNARVRQNLQTLRTSRTTSTVSTFIINLRCDQSISTAASLGSLVERGKQAKARAPPRFGTFADSHRFKV
jgi:hypothetical protein